MAACAGGGFDEAAHHRQLEERLHQPPPQGVRWTLQRVQGCFHWLAAYSLSGVSRLLRAWRFGVRQARVQQFSPDAQYDQKVAHLLACLAQVALAPDQCTLLFLDEMGYTAWPEPGLQWAPLAPASPPVAYKQLPVAAAAAAAAATATAAAAATPNNNRQWRVVDDYMVGRQQLIRFYGHLARQYQGYRRLFVVQDNWSVHRHDDVQAALAKWPQMEIVGLPTYAPWLNPIEKLWRWLRQDVLKLHRMAGDFLGLRQQVRDFLGSFAQGWQKLLRYVGLQGEGLLARALSHYST